MFQPAMLVYWSVNSWKHLEKKIQHLPFSAQQVVYSLATLQTSSTFWSFVIFQPSLSSPPKKTCHFEGDNKIDFSNKCVLFLFQLFVLVYQLLPSDLLIPQMEVTNNPWKGHLKPPQKVTRKNLVFIIAILMTNNCPGWTQKKTPPFESMYLLL